MIEIKQYGAMRSGTNYIKWLIINNFIDVQVNTSIHNNIESFKHGMHNPELGYNLNVIVTIKNPYSIYKSKMRANNKDQPSIAKYFNMYCELYTDYMKLLQLCDIGMFVDTYYLSNNDERRDNVLVSISQKFNLKRKNENWLYSSKKMGAGRGEALDTRMPFDYTKKDIQYYQNHEYMQLYKQSEIKQIREILTPHEDMLNYFGFKITQDSEP